MTVSHIISHYRIIKKLGAGGMGEVYLAEDTKLERQVAIKFIHGNLAPDETAKKRLMREARTAAKLDHSNICSIYEVAEEGDLNFIVMQYIEGETLASKIKRGPLDLDESIHIGLQVAEALAAAHSFGITHRDIKPQNIIITTHGQVKVLDFGLAKVAPSDGYLGTTAETQSLLTKPGVIVGTAPYMSPEQATGGTVDIRSDLFSFGATLYECLAGRPAFSGANTMEILAQVIKVDPPPPSQFNARVPSMFDRVILKTLAKDVNARYQSADEIISDLRTVSATLESPTESTMEKRLPTHLGLLRAVRPGFSRVLRRRRTLFTVGLVMATIALLTLWIFRQPLFNSGTYKPSPLALHWYERGVSALRDGTYLKASKALQEATSTDNEFALAHARLAEAWMELDYTGKASDEMLKAEALAREQSRFRDLDVLYFRAINATVRRDFAQACSSYREILHVAPDQPQIHVDLARAYEKNDEIDKAIDEYEKATQLTPEYATAFLRLGVLRGRKLELNEALEAFKNAEKLYEAQTNEEGILEVYYQRGFFLNNQLRLAEARTEFQQVLERAKEYTYQRIKALLQLSSIYSTEGNMKKGETYVLEAINLAQQNRMENLYTTGLNDLGNVFFYNGNYQEAEKFFKQAIEHAQGYKGLRNEMRAVLSLGSLYINQGRTEEGLEKVQRALDFYSQGGYRKEASQALILIGQANKQIGNYDAAFEAFKQQLHLAQQVSDVSLSAYAHSSLGTLLASKEQYPEALSHFDETYRISSLLKSQFDIGYDSLHRGSVLWQMGRYEEAGKAFDQAYSVAKSQDNTYKKLLTEIHLEMARMALSKQDYQSVKAIITQGLQLSGTQYEEVSILAKTTLGLALAFSGVKARGQQLCQEGFDLATKAGNPSLKSIASLALAESMLENGDVESAYKVALQAQESFRSSGQSASEWRAWLIAARAIKQGDGIYTAQEAVSHASDLLQGLEQKWGSEYYNEYLKRPDIQNYHKQLNELRVTR